MAAHDRPFPPGGLPPAPSKIFKMACDLAYKREYLLEAYRVDDQTGQMALRKIGPFEIRVEFEVGLGAQLMRYTVMIWHEEHLVFNAWCSRVGLDGTVVGDVVTDEDGPWKFRLRARSEADERS